MSNHETRLPYVVSEDVSGLLKNWADQESHRLPSAQHFEDLSLELSSELALATGCPVELVKAAELRDGFDYQLARNNNHPILSLDRAYSSKHNTSIAGHIDTTRAVDQDLKDMGIIARPGTPSVDEQIQSLKTPQESPVTLVDDVIFSGSSIIDIAKRLRAVNRPVAKVIAGIAIGKGLQNIEDNDIEVAYVRYYKEVEDEVCERDFLAGVPMSGRTVVTDEGDSWSAPYFRPFGHPEKWASIPAANVQRFSKFCVEQSVNLWDAVEQASDYEIPANMVPRRIHLLDGTHSIVKSLRRHL